MEPIDTFLKKINEDLDYKIPVNALISFIDPDTGKFLCKLAADFIKSQTSRSTLTVLHLSMKTKLLKLAILNITKTTFTATLSNYMKKNNC